MIKRLLKSKTIAGAITMLSGFLVSNSAEIFTPEVMAEYGVYIKAIAVLLASSGFGGTVYGRVKAQGPLDAPPVQEDANQDEDIGR